MMRNRTIAFAVVGALATAMLIVNLGGGWDPTI
jgi:hypothetical protein